MTADVILNLAIILLLAWILISVKRLTKAVEDMHDWRLDELKVRRTRYEWRELERQRRLRKTEEELAEEFRKLK